LEIVIIIPAYNEEEFIEQCLKSLLNQTLKAKNIVVVDDGSIDASPEIVKELSAKHENLKLVLKSKSYSHEPGGKIVEAFNSGLKSLTVDYDIICKFDADLIFPSNYLESLVYAFQHNPRLGMYGGFCKVKKNDRWSVEQLTNTDHLRGALKAYRKSCFKDISGLTPAMGWDTIDEMKARFHGWQVEISSNLLVKHLKPTGQQYKKDLAKLFGISLFRMRYNWILAFLTCAKMGNNKRSLRFLAESFLAYLRSNSKKNTFLLSLEEGAFIRNYRWSKIKERFSF